MQFSPKVDIDAPKQIPIRFVAQAAFDIRKLAKDFQHQDPTFDTAPALKAVNDYFHQAHRRIPLPFATNEYLRANHFNAAIPQEREEPLRQAATAIDNTEDSLLITIHERLKAKADKDEHTFQRKTFEEQEARAYLESAVKKFDTLFEDAKLEFKHQREINEEPWHDVLSNSGSDDEEDHYMIISAQRSPIEQHLESSYDGYEMADNNRSVVSEASFATASEYNLTDFEHD